MVCDFDSLIVRKFEFSQHLSSLREFEGVLDFEGSRV